jgi:glycosyltransferase involved in cell wall biosynthesis
MRETSILITAPSLDTTKNVSGISSVTNFIIGNNSSRRYTNFELGRKDDEKRNLLWFFGIVKSTIRWMFVVASKKIQLVHFNFALSKAAIVRDAPLILFAKLIRKRIVIHLHGGEYLMQEKPPGWLKFILKSVFSGNTQVIVLSPIEKTAMEENYRVKNLKVLPNCVDLNDAITFKREYSTNEAIRLLFMGRIRTVKGLGFIYDALLILKNNKLPFKFYMAGAGPDEKEYVEKFSALLGGDFEFKGVVSGEAKTAILKNSDIFLLPSSFPEGIPMAMLESMSFGLVPVVSGAGSIKYVVKNKENGIVVSDDLPKQIAAAITSLNTEREEIKRLSINASNFIFNNYSPVNYIAELNKIYDAA